MPNNQVKNYNGGVILVVLSSILRAIDIHLPIFGDLYLPLICSFYYLSGYAFRKYYGSWFSRLSKTVMLLLYMPTLLLAYKFACGSLLSCTPLTLILDVIPSFMGIFMLVVIAKLIENHRSKILNEYMSFLGANTFSVLMMHIICFKLVSLLIIAIYGADFSILYESPTPHLYSEKGWFLIFILSAITLPLVVKYLYNKIILKIYGKT